MLEDNNRALPAMVNRTIETFKTLVDGLRPKHPWQVMHDIAINIR